MKAYVYDIESTPNFFCVVFVDITFNIEDAIKQISENYNTSILDLFSNSDKIHKFIIHKTQTEYLRLIKFLEQEMILFGFNNHNYDDFLLKYLQLSHPSWLKIYTNKRRDKIVELILTELYNLTYSIIEGGSKWYTNETLKQLYYYKVNYITIDLFLLGFETVERTSLKQLAINLKYPRIQDMPFAPGHFVHQSQVDTFVNYCTNDCLVTLNFQDTIKDLIEYRFRILTTYNFTKKEDKMKILSANKAKLGDIFGQFFYIKKTNLDFKSIKDLRTDRPMISLSDVVLPMIKFKTEYMNNILNKIKSDIIYNTRGELGYSITIGNKVFDMKMGGLHSKDSDAIYKSGEFLYKDADVTSFYPYLINKHKIKPEHLTDDYWEMAGILIENRAAAKKLGKKGDILKQAEADTLKIVLNSWLFGKLNFEGWTYDPLAALKVTINGQLALLMMIEELDLAGIPTISANTDGIICKISSTNEHLYNEICKKWEDYFNLTLEFNDYDLYVCRDINNYAARYLHTGEIKKKGIFEDKVLYNKGYGMPIVSKSIINYFFENIPILETIYNCKDIYDFCLSQKLGKEFSPILSYFKDGYLVEERLQKNIRFYVSNKGGILEKKQYNGGKIALKKGNYVTIFNDYFPKSINEYGIFYDYYKNEALRIINPIENKVMPSAERFLKRKRVKLPKTITIKK